LDGLQEEIRYVFNKEIGLCEDSTKINLCTKLTHIVALLSGRVFVGRPLSREEEWLESRINYTINCVAARGAIRKYLVYLQPFVDPFLTEIKKQARGKDKLRSGEERHLSA